MHPDLDSWISLHGTGEPQKLAHGNYDPRWATTRLELDSRGLRALERFDFKTRVAILMTDGGRIKQPKPALFDTPISSGRVRRLTRSRSGGAAVAQARKVSLTPNARQTSSARCQHLQADV